MQWTENEHAEGTHVYKYVLAFHKMSSDPLFFLIVFRTCRKRSKFSYSNFSVGVVAALHFDLDMSSMGLIFLVPSGFVPDKSLIEAF